MGGHRDGAFKHFVSLRHLMGMRSIARMLESPLGIGVVATGAVATAACTIVLALVDASLLRQPPFRDPQQLAVLYIARQSPDRGVTRERWSVRRYSLLRDAPRPAIFTELASFTRTAMLTLTGDGEPEPVDGEVVSPSYFRVLSITSALGGTFTTTEADVASVRPEVILGYDLWRRRYASDSA